MILHRSDGPTVQTCFATLEGTVLEEPARGESEIEWRPCCISLLEET